MVKSVFVAALRNMIRNKFFSLINILGLSISMSLGLLIIIIITGQFAFDTFHHDPDRIHRVNTIALRTDGGREPYASAPLPIGRVLKEDYTFAEHVVRVNRNFNSDVQFKNINVPIQGLFIDPSFLDVFNFPLERGNPATALTSPNSVVLTHEAAIKIFGAEEPVGQTISFSTYGEFQVTGVLKKTVGNSHFEFEALGSSNALPLLEKEGKLAASLDDWNNYYSGYVYVKLKEGSSMQEAQLALDDMARKYYVNLKLETRDRGYEFYLQPLRDITPGPMLSQSMGKGMPDLLIIFLSVLAGIVMLMACFNYTNLTIAKSLSRAREIGVRKIVGAQRFQVFLQFVGESVLVSFISLGCSYLLLQVLKPAFMQLNIAQEFSTNLTENFSLYICFLLFAAVIGIIAGLLPAGYLSAFKPVAVLKNAGNIKVYSRLTFRKALIVAQFTLSLVFIIVVSVIYNQVNFMLHKDYGFDEKDKINIRLQGMEFQKLAHEISKLTGVISVGGVSHRLGTWDDHSGDYKRSPADEAFVMRDFMVDEKYLTNLNLTFLAGENFDYLKEGRIENHVILNEKALPIFNFTDPLSAIGQTIYVQDSTMLTVIGVVRDFHFRPLSYEIGPLALRYNLRELTILSAKIEPGKGEVLYSSLEAIWKKLDPIRPFEARMMEEEIDDAYTDAGFKDILKIVSYVSLLAVSLACLGMLGMTMYSTQTRKKEIGVRKVMGATSTEIAFQLSRSFLSLIGIAAVLGAPLGYLVGGMFLQQYAYKAPVSILLFAGGMLGITLFGAVIIASQTWKAAMANPVNSLKYE